jgi:hypothetical protein
VRGRAAGSTVSSRAIVFKLRMIYQGHTCQAGWCVKLAGSISTNIENLRFGGHATLHDHHRFRHESYPSTKAKCEPLQRPNCIEFVAQVCTSLPSGLLVELPTSTIVPRSHSSCSPIVLLSGSCMFARLEVVVRERTEPWTILHLRASKKGTEKPIPARCQCVS